MSCVMWCFRGVNARWVAVSRSQLALRTKRVRISLDGAIRAAPYAVTKPHQGKIKAKYGNFLISRGKKHDPHVRRTKTRFHFFRVLGTRTPDLTIWVLPFYQLSYEHIALDDVFLQII